MPYIKGGGTPYDVLTPNLDITHATVTLNIGPSSVDVYSINGSGLIDSLIFGLSNVTNINYLEVFLVIDGTEIPLTSLEPGQGNSAYGIWKGIQDLPTTTGYANGMEVHNIPFKNSFILRFKNSSSYTFAPVLNLSCFTHLE
jgi:hypothetical protein